MRNPFRPAPLSAKQIAAERIAGMLGRYTQKPQSNTMRYAALAAGAALLYASYRQRSSDTH